MAVFIPGQSWAGAAPLEGVIAIKEFVFFQKKY